MIQGLTDFSDTIAALVAGAAPLVVAIRVGPDRHISGIHWRDDTIVTVDQALPAQESYSLILSSGTMVAARPGPRDAGSNLALLRLDSPVGAPRVSDAGEPAVGSLILLIGAAFDGAPTARLGLVHARGHGRAGVGPMLDIRGIETDAGGAVLDGSGRLCGLAAATASAAVGLIPCAAIVRLTEPGAGAPTVAPPSTGPNPGAGARRGWLGVALQPITVPEPLVARAGQTSGRMVVNITHGGPADAAGLRVGDVLLALNGYSTSGSHALRAFLGPDRIGTQIAVRLLRDGTVLTTFLTVASQPA